MRRAGRDATAQEALHELADEIPTGDRQAARLIFHLSKHENTRRRQCIRAHGGVRCQIGRAARPSGRRLAGSRASIIGRRGRGKRREKSRSKGEGSPLSARGERPRSKNGATHTQRLVSAGRGAGRAQILAHETHAVSTGVEPLSGASLCFRVCFALFSCSLSLSLSLTGLASARRPNIGSLRGGHRENEPIDSAALLEPGVTNETLSRLVSHQSDEISGRDAATRRP